MWKVIILRSVGGIVAKLIIGGDEDFCRKEYEKAKDFIFCFLYDDKDKIVETKSDNSDLTKTW